MKNNRTFLEKLLDGAEVEWKTLDEIFHLRNGYTPSKGVKEYWENGSIPWFRMEDIRENGRVLNTALQKVSESAVKGGKLFPANSIIIATSATIGEHALITIPFLANQRFTVLSLKPEYIDKFNIYFLYHYCFTLDDWCQKNTTMSSFASVDMNGFRKFPIPIPPLSVQTEIVKILDALTALTSELTSELTLRRKQYEYYREKLLSEEELRKAGVEWRTIDEIFHLKNGYTPSKSIKEYWENGSIPWFRMEDIRENGRVLNTALQKVSESAVKGGKLFPANSIILSTTATIGEHALVQVEHLSNQQLTNFSIKEEFLKYLDIKFAFHYFFLIGHQIKKSANFSSLPIVSSKDLKKIQMPIPPLSVQTEIVKILDKFETLTNSISEGLPLAIEQSQKRYEYYRELLLNFS